MDPTEDQIRAFVYGDKPQTAFFSEGAARDSKASDANGHNVYVSAPYVTIKAKGEIDSVCIPATAEHRKRFRDEWEQYERRKSMAAPSPLMAIPTMTRAVARTMFEIGIFTVEQLAGAEVADRVEVTPDSRAETLDPMSTDGDAGDELALPGVLPTYLVKWQVLARHFLALKTFAQTGQKPRVKLEAVA